MTPERIQDLRAIESRMTPVVDNICANATKYYGQQRTWITNVQEFTSEVMNLSALRNAAPEMLDEIVRLQRIEEAAREILCEVRDRNPTKIKLTALLASKGGAL